MRKLLLVVGVVLGAVVVITAGGVLLWLRHRPLNTPRQVAAAYLQRWQAQDWEGMRRLVDRPPPEFVQTHAQMVKDLQASGVHVTGGGLRTTGATSEEPVSVELSLKTLGTWDYQETLHLARRARRWRVAWSPSTVHPELAAGRRFSRVFHWPDRASILGRDGAVLQGPSDVVVIGVVPARVTDSQAVVSAFQQYAGVDPATVTRILQKPGAQPAWFLPVLQVRSDRFGAMSPQLIAVPGIVVQHTKGRATPSDGFAAHVLGTTGPVTAERLAQLGDPYVTGTVVGLSGLEGAFERQLAGTPSAEIRLVDQGGNVVTVLNRF